MNINIVLDGHTLPIPTIPFTMRPLEVSTDNVTLGGQLYTDFSGRRQSWVLNYEVLYEAEYDLIFGIYSDQFANFTYPLLTIDYYGVVNQPVRVTINNKDIRKDGCYMRGVIVTLTQADPIGSIS